jgi:hypothetical protein
MPTTTTPGVDITRALLNADLGVDLVWLPMNTLNCAANAGCYNLTITQNTNTVATCSGYISSFTLTTNSCSGSPGTLAVSDALSSGSTIAAGTIVTGVVSTGSGGAGTFTVSTSQTAGTSRRPITITATTTTLASSDFHMLAQQNPTSPATNPCAILQMTIPLSSPCTEAPLSPRNPDPQVINVFFVNALNGPPGTLLYGWSEICNNGVSIGMNTFFAPSPLQARPDTIAHELAHNLCLDHTTFGAGPWTPVPYPANGGIIPPVNAMPALFGECDSGYPGCLLNLMTTGSLRTESIVPCILAENYSSEGTTVPVGCTPPTNLLTVQTPGLYIGTADQVSIPTQEGTTLPTSQWREVLDPASITPTPGSPSGLLFAQPTPPLMFSGLVSPIPHQTTKAQLGTAGSSSGRAVFDLSGLIGGRRGETLVGWVLTLPDGQTFARHGGPHILSQSRADLIQDVGYYPSAEDHPLKRNIAYQPGADNNPDSPSMGTIGPSPCAFATAECLVVKFQPPGLGANDTISFSESILNGGAPITNADLCKAKITYMFSDGFMTTSNFGRCPPASLPLIASSWRPDPHVAPHVVKSNVLLADGGSPIRPCTPGSEGQCPPAQAADIDANFEGGQLGTTCNNGPISGKTIPGPNFTVSVGQTCTFQKVEFLGALTVNGGYAFLENSQVDGNVQVIAGTLSLLNSTVSAGNVSVSGPGAYNILDSQISGNVTIQNLVANPQNPGPFTVCASQVQGNVTLQGNQAANQIGTTGPVSCPKGNTIGGSLTCTMNANVTSGGNTVGGHFSGQCKS